MTTERLRRVFADEVTHYKGPSSLGTVVSAFHVYL
jgi:hypothetical protein